MKKTFFGGILLFFFAGSFPGFSQSSLSGIQLIEKSIAGMGGKELLRGLENIEIEGIGHAYLLEQSERPEGPWIVNYFQVKQFSDYGKDRLFVEKQIKNSQQREWKATTLIYGEGALATKLSDGSFVPARPFLEGEVKERLHSSPEQILLGALESQDLTVEKDTVLQGVAHKVLSFTYKEVLANLYLNSNTYLPTLFRTVNTFPGDIMWSVWGKVKTDIFFSLWTLTPEGFLYPMQYNKYRNGQLLEEFTIVSITVNKELQDDYLAVPDGVKAAYKVLPKMEISDLPLGRPDKQARELAPGILLIPGFWNVGIIQQEDGVLLLEAPISDAYTAKVLAEADKTYPGKEVKGVISTSDAWPHVGGVGESFLQNLPIYSHALTEPFLGRLISAKLGKKQVRSLSEVGPDIKKVSGKLSIGNGRNRIEIYPIEGESSERMLMVYFPEHKLLYASDLVQLNSDGSFFQKSYLRELVAAVDRNGLEVENLFAMHTDIIKYQEILNSL